jgi:hypothetical protein
VYTVTELEDALKATLEIGGLDAKIFHGDPQKGFPGENLSSPSVFIMFEKSVESGFKSVQINGTAFSFRLFAVVKNLRSTTSAGRGDIATAGVHELLQTVRTLLEGKSLGLNIQPLRFIYGKADLMPGRLSVGQQEWLLEVFE